MKILAIFLVVLAFSLAHADEAQANQAVAAAVTPKVAVKPATIPPKVGAKKKSKKPKTKKKAVKTTGSLKVQRDIDIKGLVACGSLVANNATVKGTLISRTIKTKNVRAGLVSAGELRTNRLSSPTGVIIVEGDLLITHSRKAPPKNATSLHTSRLDKYRKGTPVKKKPTPKPNSKTPTPKPTPAKTAAAAASKVLDKTAKGHAFLAEEIIISGVKQWRLIRHQHFQSYQPSEAWKLQDGSVVPTSTCSSVANADRFLGGHCNVNQGPVSRHFTELPPHSEVRVTARYHFIDNWQGETAYAQIDGQYMWSQSHRLPKDSRGIQICGNDKFPETRLSSPIDVTLPHSADALTIAFGSSQLSESESSCDRSFGVDDVSIYVR